MADQDDIPVLDDLIESGIEITLSDLGLDDDPPLSASHTDSQEITFDPAEAAALVHDPLADNPALEQAVRRILDEHMELAWQEIRLAIRQHLDRS
ncbi:MAG TPA: hypothetical protein VMZ32_04965 [Gammaproteobacteria bacterium]|nr:hypothetical protein [Gammaproteobacteria bacterium]